MGSAHRGDAMLRNVINFPIFKNTMATTGVVKCDMDDGGKVWEIREIPGNPGKTTEVRFFGKSGKSGKTGKSDGGKSGKSATGTWEIREIRRW